MQNIRLRFFLFFTLSLFMARTHGMTDTSKPEETDALLLLSLVHNNLAGANDERVAAQPTEPDYKDDSLTCKICGQTFTRKLHLRDHDYAHTGIKPYTCTICNKKFARKRSMREHQVIHANDAQQHKCKTCGKGFKYPCRLIKHQSTHKPKKFTCTTCNVRLSDKFSLAEHKKTLSHKRILQKK